MNKRTIKTYSELITIPSFEEKFEYLKIGGRIGEETFGSHRYLNQKFYTSNEWRRVRNEVIVRDRGCDLGFYGLEIIGHIVVHHINPISIEDLLYHPEIALNPEYLISLSETTHKAIHYGDINLLFSNMIVERKPNDTCPWRK